MLLPLLGLVLGLLVSSVAAALVFRWHPRWKVTLPNLALFSAGSFFYALVLSAGYTGIFADNNGTLQSGGAVVGYLALLVVAVIGGGTATTYMGRKVFNLK